MGGFVSSAGYAIATKEQLTEDSGHGSELLEAIRSVDAEDILDKSKGDALSKGVALAQGLWFTMQCLARVHQHLAITELEVATLGFAVVNMFIWLLWWDKPLDVQRPMVVGSAELLDAQLITSITPGGISPLDRLGYAIGGPDKTHEYDPLSSTSVPSFWSLPMSNNFQHGTMGITALAGSMFGAIHCAAWNTNFPTTTEMWLWRSSSLVIGAIPVVAFLALLLDFPIDEKAKLRNRISIISEFVALGGLPIYVVARLILIALSLAALRSLPPSAFVDANWGAYIPHI